MSARGDSSSSVHTGAFVRYAWLGGALLLGGCYLSHRREAPIEPGRMDGSFATNIDASAARRDAGVRGGHDGGTRGDDGGARDGGARDGAGDEVGPDAGLGDSAVPMPPVVPDGGFEPGTIAFDYFDFCIRIGEIECQAEERCCLIPERRFPDIEVCRDEIARFCAGLASTMGWLEGRTTWHEEAVDPVLRAWWDAASRCGVPAIALDTRGPLWGDVPRGGDCTPPSLGQAYQYWINAACQRGLYCQVTGTPDSFAGTCTDPGTTGDPCFVAGGCAASHYCMEVPDPTTAAAGVCEPRRARGEPCTFDLQCESDYCPDAVERCAPSRPVWCLIAG